MRCHSVMAQKQTTGTGDDNALATVPLPLQKRRQAEITE